MRIEIYHASKYGNGKEVAEELRRLLEAKGHHARAQHITDASPGSLPDADLYVFGSPGRIGKPIGGMRRFLKKVNRPAGTRYAIFSTEIAPRPDKDGRMPTEEEVAKWQRIQPLMDELLRTKGLKKVADAKVYVNDVKGPLEEGWRKKVEQFADALADHT